MRESITSFLLAFWMAIPGVPLAGAVSEVIATRIPTTLLHGPDGIEVAPDGTVFVANWGRSGNGTTVVMIEPGGRERLVADGLAAPDGLALDSQGRLYVSCWTSGDVIRLTRTAGGGNWTREVLVTGLRNPSDCAFGPDGLLYVSEMASYRGTKVLRLRPDGTVETFADGLEAPLGLVFGPDGTLYVSSYTTGRVTAISRDGARRLVATLPGEGRPSFQYLAMDATGSLYCPSYSDSKIWRISPAGEVERLNVVKKGSAAGAKVQTPNSVCVRDGILWFTEFGTNSVYRCPLR